MKKAVALVLVLTLFLLSFAVTAFAATESNPYISSYSAAISNPSGKTVRVDFSVFGTGYMSSLGANTIYLYEDGTLIKAFVKSNPLYAPTMVTSNAYYYYGYVTYTGKSGSTYYAEVHCFATNASGTGTETCSTNSITIP